MNINSKFGRPKSHDIFNCIESKSVDSSEAGSEDESLRAHRNEIESSVARLRLDLRHNFFKESKRFARTNPEVLDALWKAANPTDPLFLETPDENIEKKWKTPYEASLLFDDRGRWGSLGTFVVVSLTASIGPATYSIFPWETISSGIGLVFLVPIVFAWIFVALPIMSLEQALGQMMRSGPLKVFTMINPRLSGLGLAFILLLTVHVASETLLGGQAFYFFLSSSNSVLPWAVTEQHIDECLLYLSKGACDVSPYCLTSLETETCVPSSLKIAIDYYTALVVGSSSYAGAPRFQWKLFVYCSVTLLAAGLLIYMGTPIIGPVGSFALIVTILLLGLLVMSVPMGTRNSNIDEQIPMKGCLADFTDLGNWSKLFSDSTYWLQGIIVALASSYVIRGHNYILASYTSFGSNLLRLGYFTLLLQIYVYLITTVILSRTIYSSTDQIEALIGSRLVLDSIQSTLSFILFPVALGSLPGAPMFSMIFFLMLWFQSTIRLALLGFIVLIALMESKLFYRVRKIYLCIWIIVLFLWVSLPYLVNFGDEGQRRYKELGIHRLSQLDRTTVYFIIPFSGAVHLVSIDMSHGWSIVKSRLGWAGPVARTSIIGFFFFCYTVLIFTVAKIAHYGLLVLLAFIIGQIVVWFIASRIAARGRFTYMDIVYSWSISGLDSLRKLINDSLAGRDPSPNRLFVLWSITLTLFCPLFLYATSIASFAPTHINVKFESTTTNKLIAGATFTVMAFPLALSLIQPNWFSLIAPTSRYQWTVYEAPKRSRGPKYGIRRYPIRFWEEFTPIYHIWKNISKLRYEKLR